MLEVSVALYFVIQLRSTQVWSVVRMLSPPLIPHLPHAEVSPDGHHSPRLFSIGIALNVVVGANLNFVLSSLRPKPLSSLVHGHKRTRPKTNAV